MPQSQLQLPEGFEEISITPSFLDEEAKKFGLSKSSGFRTPQRNKKVGGVETSYHLKGQAGDYIGTLEQRRNFYNYLKTNYKYDLKELLYEDDHIHVATEAVPEGFVEESKASKILQKPKQTDSFFREQFKEAFRKSHVGGFAPVTQETISPEKIEKVKKYLRKPPETSEELFARQKATAKKLGIENVQVPGAAEKAEALKPPYQRIAEGLLSLPMAAAEIGGYAALAGLSSQGAPGTIGYNPYAAKAAEKLSELIGQPELAEFEKARELYNKKGYKHPQQALADPEIALQLLKATPFFGPQAAHGIKQFESGDVAGGLITTGMLFAPFLGKAAKGGRFKAVEEPLASRIAEYEDRTGITPETQIQGAKIAKAVEPEAFVPVVETPTTVIPEATVETTKVPEGFIEAPTTKVMTPEGSGTSVISAEELARNEVFYTISSDGRPKTYQGKQPDNPSLKPNEVIVGINKSTGDIRVAGGLPETFTKNEAKIRKALVKEKIISKPSIMKKPVEKPKKLGKKELKKQYQTDLEHNLDRMFEGAKRVEEGKYGYTEPQSELDGLSLASLEDEINQRTLEHIKEGIFTKAELDDIEFAQHAKAYPESLDAMALEGAKEVDTLATPTPISRVATNIKKHPEGGFEVTIGDNQYRIFRDPDDRVWYLDSSGRLPYEPHTNWGSNRLLSTTTKADAIKELESKIAKGYYKGAEIPKTPPTTEALSKPIELTPENIRKALGEYEIHYEFEPDSLLHTLERKGFPKGGSSTDLIAALKEAGLITEAGITPTRKTSLGTINPPTQRYKFTDEVTEGKQPPNTDVDKYGTVTPRDIETAATSTEPTKPTIMAKPVAKPKLTKKEAPVQAKPSRNNPAKIQELRDDFVSLQNETEEGIRQRYDLSRDADPWAAQENHLTNLIHEYAKERGIDFSKAQDELMLSNYQWEQSKAAIIPETKIPIETPIETGIPEGFSVEESPVTAGKWRVRTPEGITKNYPTKELAEARLAEEIAHHENIAQFKENQKTKRGSGGLDTEDMGRLTQMALHHIKQGVESFADFVEKMADVTKDKVILKQIYDQVNESQLKEFQSGLNPLAAAKYFEDLNIPPGSPRIPPGGTGSFRTIYPTDRGHVNPFGSPLSRAGQPGQYEIREPVYGKAGSDLVRNAEYNVAELETKWGKLLDDINDNLNKAYQVVTGKTLFPKGLKRLSGKAERDAFTKDFVDLIELDFDDPARQAISTSTTPLGDALRIHDALTEEWRQYIIHTQRELGRTIPDDWGVTTKGYFRHLFLGDIQIRVDGKFIGTAPTYAEAQRMALDIWKTNPNANVEAVARNMFEGDPTLRLSNRKYWGFLGRVKKTLDQNNPLITITADDIRADLVGVVGREAARQKSFGALFKREGYKGYSDDYVKVMKIHSAQLANSQEISKLHHSMQPIIEHLKSNGLGGLAEDITEHINHIWGVPTKNELRFGDWIRRRGNPVTKILSNYVANPDFALRSLAWKIGRVNNFLHLDWNIRSASVNRFQPLTTLWPYVTSKQYASYEAAMAHPSTWERLSNLDVLRGKPKVEVGASMGTNPFTIASEWNRGVGYLHGEWDAARLGITDPREVHRWAMDWAERVEFNNSKWNVAPVLRSPIAKIIGQYKGYLLKDIENIQQTFRTTPIEPIPKKLRIAKQLGARFATGGLNTALKAMPWIAGYEILTALNDQFKSMGISDYWSEQLSEALMMGSPSLIGLDLSGSFSLIDFYGNSTLETLANFAFGPTVQKGIRMAEAKTPEKFFRALTPYAKATNILDAITGQQTSTDLDANYKLEISRYEAIMEALGYTLERKSLYFLMKEAKINPRSGEKRLQRPRREKRLLKDVGPE